MLGCVLRIAPIAALLVGLVAAVPSSAQVAGARIIFAGSTGISVMNPDGSGVTALRGSGQQPLPSPDGSQIAFSDNNQLRVMNSDGSAEHFVANSTAIGRQAWSPDGTRIAFLGTSTKDIYVVSALGGAPQRLTFDGL